jgi:uncharacterized membrane protein
MKLKKGDKLVCIKEEISYFILGKIYEVSFTFDTIVPTYNLTSVYDENDNIIFFYNDEYGDIYQLNKLYKTFITLKQLRKEKLEKLKYEV